MWLLNTKTAEFMQFNGPYDDKLIKDGGYAILSHVWQESPKEQLFQDIQALQSHIATSPNNTPRSRASEKIRNYCIPAERDGYRWVWIDTCCINKESSAELSEAINSMFQWYSSAALCYAYLFDVDNDALDPESQFYKSRWFTRSWTLQELIAPRHLLFLLNDWNIFGNRAQLSKHVETITTIDEAILLRRADVRECAISERMSWAAQRKITRVEDEAYCLMGIFGVNMPTIYGEGRAAFY